MVMTVANILKVKGRIYKSVKPTETIREFAKHLKDERIGAMIVTTDGKALDGIISERDIALGLAEHGDRLPNMKVSQLMTKRVEVCSPQDSIEEVMDMMTHRRIRHLPVQDEGELVGIVTIGDVVKAHLVEAHLTTTSRLTLARSA
ncbi:CBS domain-containing protein [Methyloceanibacter methanicus]|nr:CBS domain-containing protein [Methyloceanibacter methanicus]